MLPFIIKNVWFIFFYFFLFANPEIINVKENRSSNQEWTIQTLANLGIQDKGRRHTKTQFNTENGKDFDTYSSGFLSCTNAAQKPITAMITTPAAATYQHTWLSSLDYSQNPLCYFVSPVYANKYK